jgi:hypothetical protein
MANLKKAWLTESHILGTGWTLSLESAKVEQEYERLIVSQSNFPDEPSDKHPKRHTVVIGLLDSEDLLKIKQAIEFTLGEL